MTVNGLELRCVLEFIEKHQKSEAHFVKEWNRRAEDLATEVDEERKQFLINEKEHARRGLVREQGIIKEFAILLGKTTKHENPSFSPPLSTSGPHRPHAVHQNPPDLGLRPYRQVEPVTSRVQICQGHADAHAVYRVSSSGRHSRRLRVVLVGVGGEPLRQASPLKGMSIR